MTRSPQLFAVKMSAKRLPRRWVEAAKRLIDALLGLRKFNAVYRDLPPCEPAGFSRTFLEAVRVHFEWGGQTIKTIPATGPLIVVANHPFGLIEGMALETLLLERRPDFALMVFHRLATIPEWRDRFIFVDPQQRRRGFLARTGSRRKREINIQGWRRSFRWVAGGRVLGIFPAGRVARFRWRRMSVVDGPWSPHIAALARRTQAPVLPIYFYGHNCWASQFAGTLCPPLHDLLVFRQATNKRNRTFRATIGRLIQPAELSRFASDDDAIEFLRQETERLRSTRWTINAGKGG